MKVEIRRIKNLETPDGELVRVLNLDANALTAEQLAAKVGSAIIEEGKRAFGPDLEMVSNQTIFGGHARDKSNGDCIVAK